MAVPVRGAASGRAWGGEQTFGVAGLAMLRRCCPRRAVTFLENHDTGSTLGHWPFPRQGLQEGYAYILTHPGGRRGWGACGGSEVTGL